MTTPARVDNGAAPILRLRHAHLKPLESPDGETARLARQCPTCKVGTLRLHRDRRTLELLARDVCTLCGQRVRYVDIVELRKRDWAEA